MFFNVFNRALVCAGIFALTACGGGEPVESTSSSIQAASSSALQQSPSPVAATGNPAQENGIVRAAPVVSAAEREAEQQRMVPYEQSFALEMNRRAQERPEHLRGQGERFPAPAQPVCDAATDPAQPSACPGSPADAALPAATPTVAPAGMQIGTPAGTPAGTPTAPAMATPAQAL